MTFEWDESKNLPPLNLEEIEKIKNIKDEDIDCSDIPELSLEQMKQMYEKGKIIRKNKPNAHIDDDILAVFKNKSVDWEEKLNDFLRSVVAFAS